MLKLPVNNLQEIIELTNIGKNNYQDIINIDENNNQDNQHEIINEDANDNNNNEYDNNDDGEDSNNNNNEDYSNKEYNSDNINEDDDIELLVLKEFNLSENLIKGLQLLYIKKKYTLSNKAFNEIMTIFDMYWNSCCVFIGKNADCNICPICKEPCLRIQYKNPSRAMIIQYWHEYTSSEEYISNNGKIGDVFDGIKYKSLGALGLFSDYQDVALIASTDGYQLFKQKQDDC
ncbi:hypothetical protein RhiirC2_794880 [Rhizophagus irregularis]|uniref:Uncharacterized protein n=1 Tax=Rhizophagus irregularis TaxID=588596 RepID=A0A2N1MCN8_9GLOM|nr:hypothetical protein RhiirC2_794880 [Rhizophagus irregularis]